MFYPKADCCPFNCDEPVNLSGAISDDMKPSAKKIETEECYDTQKEMMKKIQETDFALIDLNLFLDTHPDCSEALKLFTELSEASEILKKDYQAKYGPLYATKSSGEVPFKWVESCYKWPWER